MNIPFVIIHELNKIKGKVGANLRLSGSSINIENEEVIELITNLNERYKYKNENYSKFDKVNTTVFYKEFAKYSKEKNETNFVSFSKLAAEDLKTGIQGIAPAKGGYLIFVQYEHLKKYVGVFLVRNTVGLRFSEDLVEDAFDIKKVMHIDFENLAMACRVNLETYETDETRYLSFINKKSDDLSQYFTRWISADDSETNEEDTKQLFQLFNTIATPIDKETGNNIERAVFLNNINKFISTSEGRIVNLKTLGEHFYGNENHIIDYSDQNDLIISGEFKAHPKTMKRFVQITAKADNIELSFPNTAYKTIVRFNDDNPNQIIIDSEKLANEIRNSANNNK